MEILIKEGEFINYLIEFEDGDFETSATFNVYEVISWEYPSYEISETKHYLKGYIKWDGCSHILFGDKDGYLHLCGKPTFENHKKVMDKIWEVCSKKIKRWDNECATT